MQEPNNPLLRLEAHGQSVWLDDIRRDLLDDGSLGRMIAEDGISGLTSNPAIFERAIRSGVYSEAIMDCRHSGLAPQAIFERLAVEDIGRAADILLPVYEQSRRIDGYASLEVSPHLADDCEATCAAARRLWSLVDRPNVMIKVPATSAGIAAMEILLGEGININATLLFSRDVYREVTAAWLAGLERWRSHKGEVGRVASVASFFVSRIDTAIDNIILQQLPLASPATATELATLAGTAATANARLAYQDFLSMRRGERWLALQHAGAQPQRLLWASTSTKNPAYRDVRYIEELIGAETVTTIPLTTLAAFRDHGIPRPSLTEQTEQAASVLESLERHGISLKAVTDQLTRDGVESFCQANDKILAALASQLALQEVTR